MQRPSPAQLPQRPSFPTPAAARSGSKTCPHQQVLRRDCTWRRPHCLRKIVRDRRERHRQRACRQRGRQRKRGGHGEHPGGWGEHANPCGTADRPGADETAPRVGERESGAGANPCWQARDRHVCAEESESHDAAIRAWSQLASAARAGVRAAHFGHQHVPRAHDRASRCAERRVGALVGRQIPSRKLHARVEPARDLPAVPNRRSRMPWRGS